MLSGAGRVLARLLAAALLAHGALLLLRAPRLGAADNGDFWRVMRPAGIAQAQPLEKQGRFVVPRYRVRESEPGRGLSTAAVLARVARSWTWGLDPGRGWMDLRQMGLLHLALAVVVMAWALALGLQALLVAMTAYLLVDPGYLLFFNSFYADPAMLVALPAGVFWLLRWGGSGRCGRVVGEPGLLASGTVAGVALLGGGSKVLYSPLPACLLGALVLSGLRRRPGLGLRKRVTLPLLALSLLLPAHFLWGSGGRYERVNKYHAVFGGILRVSGDPDRVLRDLGLPPEYRDLPRRDVFSGGVEKDAPVHHRLERVSRLQIASVYLKEPGAMARVAGRVQRELAARRTHLRGNYERVESGRRRFFRTRWDWSRWRSQALAAWPPAIWLLAAVAVGRLVSGIRREGAWSGREAAILFLLLWSLSQIPIVVLGDGLVSLRQHLLGARLGFDLLFLILVYDGWATARRWWRGR